MSIPKRLLIAAAGLVFAAIAVTGAVAYKTKSKVEDAFALNEQRKAEGYDLSWFEFQGLAALYRLDHGDILEGLSVIDRLHGKLSTTEGLARIPEFTDAKQTLEFYRNLQHPVTGAFYPDVRDPLFAYVGVTANMINLIKDLSGKADEPFRLKYPLRFLNRIDTPETLRAFLDDASTVGWVGAETKPPFVAAIEVMDLLEQSEELGIYAFSDAWKQAFYQWFIDNQDPETGLWGARMRGSGKIIGGGGLEESEKVIKLFVDNRGNDRIFGFPLPNKDRIFASVLDRLDPPMPDDPMRRHEWILIKDRGIRTLTRHLWKDASPAHRDAAKRLIEDFIALRFERYFVEPDGAFSLYPDAGHADLDGTGEALGMFKYIGALSPRMQTRLWGAPGETIADLGRIGTARIDRDVLSLVLDHPAVNSVRFYAADPGAALLTGVAGVHYPRGRTVLDTADLLPRVLRWAETTEQRMGNWVGKDLVLQRAGFIEPGEIPVFGGDVAERADAILKRGGILAAVGFDVLQVPRVKVVYTCAR